MKVDKHIRDAAEKWVQNESIAKDTYEVDRAFRAGAKYILDEMNQANGVQASEATAILPLVSISLPDAIEKIKGYEKEALKQAGYAKRDGADISAHCSEAMAFAYKLSYQTLEGNEC